MSQSLRPRILVVDDDVQIRRAIRYALSEDYEVELAAGGEEALDLAAAKPPQLVILDLSMPGKSGLEVCKELREWLNAPIIVLSARDQEKDKIQALDMGADDYLTKPFSAGELTARIRAHLRRANQTPQNEPVYERDGLKIDLAKRQVFLDETEAHLTKTEFALLQYLLQNAGRVITTDLLIANVWGPEYEGDTQALRVHIGHLRRKIERDPVRPQFIITESGIGYRFNG